MGTTVKQVGPSFFDQRAGDYDREYNDQTAGGFALRIRREKVLTLFDQPGGKVLDVGCGPGPMTQPIVDLGCEFWGVDSSQKMLDICHERFGENERVQFQLGDATSLAQTPEFFDAVLCMGVIDAVNDRRHAVREMLRVLRANGTLIITFSNSRSPYAWWKKYVFYPAVAWYKKLFAGRTRRVPAPDARGRGLYSKREACELLRSEGAEVVEVVGYYYNIFLSPLDEMFPTLALRVTQALEESNRTPNWIAGGWIVKAKKR